METKTALVTGAGRGIGKAIALALAAEGYQIVVNYNGSEEAANEVVALCEEKGVKAMAYRCNVADYAAVEQMMNDVVKEMGSIDVLVNNSGITKDGLLLRMKEEDFDRVVEVNLKGCFNCIRHVARIMMKQRHGSIINMSSVVGLSGNIGQANYAASKAGIIGLTKSTAKELAAASLKDEGCVAYDLFESATRSDVLMICETWSNAKALAAHEQASHFTTLVPRLEQLGELKIEKFVF